MRSLVALAPVAALCACAARPTLPVLSFASTRTPREIAGALESLGYRIDGAEPGRVSTHWRVEERVFRDRVDVTLAGGWIELRYFASCWIKEPEPRGPGYEPHAWSSWRPCPDPERAKGEYARAKEALMKARSYEGGE